MQDHFQIEFDDVLQPANTAAVKPTSCALPQSKSQPDYEPLADTKAAADTQLDGDSLQQAPLPAALADSSFGKQHQAPDKPQQKSAASDEDLEVEALESEVIRRFKYLS